MSAKGYSLQRGSSIVEYLLILLLIAGLAIPGMEFASLSLRQSYGSAALRLAQAGGTTTTNPAGCELGCAGGRPPGPGAGGLGSGGDD